MAAAGHSFWGDLRRGSGDVSPGELKGARRKPCPFFATRWSATGSTGLHCYPDLVSELNLNLENWKSARPPQAITLDGQWSRLEPLTAAQHGHSIWLAVNGHDSVWTWLSDGPYAREEDCLQALRAKENDNASRFFAILPKQPSGTAGSAAGYASLMRIDAPNGVIEVGNIMFSPQLQRTRAATEVIYLMARYVFEELGFRRYEWKCNALNLPSRRAAERFGFAFEGIFRQHMVIKGRSRDSAWYSMLDSEWPARKRTFERWLDPANFDTEGNQIQSLASLANTSK
ncbi:GNAT family N-acetyltransferase [Tunturiibacter gelidoferens]|uniref:GNAT family N-acetyltransferase n=1 Tax=Tunturiibacter gelidiferens TaxID=3069689 RepID=UPI001C843038